MSNVFTDMMYAIQAQATQIANMMRPATVTYTFRKSSDEGFKGDRDDGKSLGYVSVESGELEMWKVPCLVLHTQGDTTLHLPVEGAKGYIFSPGGDLANAFFVQSRATDENVIPPPPGQAPLSIVTEYREGSKEQLIIKDDAGVIVNQYLHEIGVKDKSFTKFKHGEALITMNKDEITIEYPDSKITLDASKILAELGSSDIKIEASKITTDSPVIDLIAGLSKINLKASKITLTSTEFEVTAPTFKWNGVPTTPVAWVATT